MNLEMSSLSQERGLLRLCAKGNYSGRRGTRFAHWGTARTICCRTIAVPDSLLFRKSTSLTVELNMKNCTDTLEVGSRAPDFSLTAANRDGTFTLGGLLAQGAVILEFLRGTW